MSIYAAVALIVGAALLLFDDVQNGLPILILVIWSVIAVAGLLLFLRRSRRRRRRERRAMRARSTTLSRGPVPSLPLTAEPRALELRRR